MPKASIYLYTGPEIGNKALEVEKRRDSLRGKYGAGLEENVFYALENSVGEMCQAMLGGSLFSQARLFIIKNAEAVSKKDDIKLLSSCFETLDETSTVILISDETNIDKTIEKYAGTNKIIFWELFESDKKKWIVNFFKRENFNINADAVETILEMVENNTEELKNRCFALTLFCDKTQPLTPEIIETVLSKTKSESAWTLFSAIAEGSLERSLEILSVLLDAKESSYSIFGALNSSWHKLRAYAALPSGARSNDIELKKIGLKSKKARDDCAKAVKFFNEKAVSNCIALTAEIDMQIRAAGPALERTLLELYLIGVFSYVK